MIKKITEDERMEKYYTASSVVQQAYASPNSGEVLFTLYSTISTVSSGLTYTQFAGVLGDYILDFYTEEEIKSVLTTDLKIPQTHIPAVINGVNKLKNNTVSIPDANADLKEKLELRPTMPAPGTRPPLAAPPQYGAPASSQSVPTAYRSPTAPQTQNSPSGAPTQGGARPLTREELMNALGGKRTMAQDIEALRAKKDAAKDDA